MIHPLTKEIEQAAIKAGNEAIAEYAKGALFQDGIHAEVCRRAAAAALAGVKGQTCDDCGSATHETGDFACPYTFDSCGGCGGYHNSFYDCWGES